MLVWEWMCIIYHLPTYILPAPSLILNTFFANINLYVEASLLTFTEAAVGLLLGTMLGISIALLIHFLPRFEEGVMTIALLIKSTPMVAIAPLLTIWLGFGMLPKIIITALLGSFQC
jgi:ABC-type nitrate/sulfonate/bicarbonate transport system permease component